jgi:membrane-associated phospholipid phosphatase
MSGQTKSGQTKSQRWVVVDAQPGPTVVDGTIMRRWPQTHRFGWLDRVAVTASQAGEVSLIWFGLTVVAFVADRLTTREAMIGVGVIAAEWIITNRGVKRFFWRDRPTPVSPDPRGVRRPSSSSLPSGHSAASACAAVFVGQHSGWILPMIVIAVLIGCSRAHLRVHYPTDVIAGWAWGASLGAFALLVL